MKRNINPLHIVNTYKVHNIPLDIIAKTHKVSLHYVINILHKATVVIPNEISMCKKILKELES